MNFNRQDSLNLMDVLKDPKFVEFLRKWEKNRNPSALTLTAKLTGTIGFLTPHTIILFD